MRLVLAEDHALLRDGLIRLLEANDFKVVAAVDNAPALDAGAADPTADVAVVDVRMPPTFTDEGLRAAIDGARGPAGLPGAGAVAVRRAALRPRAAGQRRGRRSATCSRTGSPTCGEFVDAVRRVAAGGTVLDPEVVAAIMARRRDEPLDRLTAASARCWR